MRNGIIAAGLLVASLTTAQAQEWCGYPLHQDAVIQCGYTTVAGCENAVGKGGMCFVDPYVVLNERRAGNGNFRPV